MTQENEAANQAGWHLELSYGLLPSNLYAPIAPIPVVQPQLLVLNRQLAFSLGLNPEVLQGETGTAVFSGNQLPPGSIPIAQAYAGHQFGYFAMLGDGRAVLLGEQITPDQHRFDIQLKGSGPTPFSRRGDGRAALGPMLREYLVSEAMHALGIPTTRSLAVTLTGEPVYRETTLPGAVLTRVAQSHLRVGTFEYAAALRDIHILRALADYAIQRHFPTLKGQEDLYIKLLYAVMDKQAQLVAHWISVGFIHGVMNTDNMAISGETIDYGPCAFLDAYHPNTVFSSIDHQGRYAFGKQPAIAQWNLIRFAETLVPLIHDVQEEAVAIAQAALETFPATYKRYWLSAMRKKLGLLTPDPADFTLIQELLTLMAAHQADFTSTFYQLSKLQKPSAAWWQEKAPSAWFETWKNRLSQQPESLIEAGRVMHQTNPRIVPRNHTVEEALTEASTQGNLRPFFKLLEAVTQPYSNAPELEEFSQPPASPNPEFRTFCGT